MAQGEAHSESSTLGWDSAAEEARKSWMGGTAATVPSPECVVGHRVQSGYTPVPLSLPRSGLMLEPELQHPNFTGIANPVPLLPFVFVSRAAPFSAEKQEQPGQDHASDFSCLVALLKCAWSLT